MNLWAELLMTEQEGSHPIMHLCTLLQTSQNFRNGRKLDASLFDEEDKTKKIDRNIEENKLQKEIKQCNISDLNNRLTGMLANSLK